MQNYDFDSCNDCDCVRHFFTLTDYLAKDIQQLEKEVARLRYLLSNLLPRHDGLMIRADIFSNLAGCYYEYPAYQQFISVYCNDADPLDSDSFCEELKKVAHFDEIWQFPITPATVGAVGASGYFAKNLAKTNSTRKKYSEKSNPLKKNLKTSVGGKVNMFTKTAIKSINLSTRAKRRKAAALAAFLLERIQSAEELRLNRTPDNLQNSKACYIAEISVQAVGDAIYSLMDAY
jgi:hypothetical protein